MKNVTKVLIGLIGSLTLFLQSDLGSGIVSSLWVSHPKIASAIGGIAGILALLHLPKQQ